ncbi:hypothetical protein ACIP5N_30750 [Streptomyces sp. NPDC088768]|uniref:hypothetical protein n=1 Tax=Streptomyces sp. NPDC088768 TaxID=3365894 RepID=UPI003806225B
MHTHHFRFPSVVFAVRAGSAPLTGLPRICAHREMKRFIDEEDPVTACAFFANALRLAEGVEALSTRRQICG